jgi:hypothetical protein
MLFKEIIHIYAKNHEIRKSKKKTLLIVKENGSYNYHFALEG